MRLKTLSWFTLSLLLFLAAFYCWRLGERRAQLLPSPPPSPTNAVAPTGPGPNVSVADRPAAAAVAGPETGSSSVTNARRPFPFRLSNTTESIGSLTRNESAVLLANALLDTRLAARPEIPAHLRAGGDPESYIVQSRGPLDDAFRQALAGAGATIISYVPNNAYLVRVPAAGAQRLAALPRTQAVLPFEPYYKFDQQLLPLAVQKIPLPEDARLNVLIFPGERDRALELFAQLGAEVLAEERTPFGQSIVVQTRAGSLITLAGHPAIQSLSGHHERRPANDLTRQRLRISTNTVTAAPAGNFRGLTGAGVLVNVNDTGAYADHPDLTPARITGLTTDLDGHGTHVVGTILGNGSKSATVTKASGSTNGANFRGMAPSAKAFVQSIAPGAFTDELLQRGAALTNALISNNSWSYGVNEYDIHAASYDAAVRDALPGVTGAQPLLLVFPAGNGGGGNGSGLGGIPGGIESPGTAKNVISVGGTELPRYITNLVVDAEGNTNSPFLGNTDSDNQIVFFSARGNVGIGQEGAFGRFKPDVVAPGSMLVSCANANITYPTNFTGSEVNNFRFLILAGLSTNLFSVEVPANATQLTISVTTNASTSLPLPFIHILAPGTADFLGVNVGTLVPPALVPGTVNYYLGNTGSNAVNLDLQVTVTLTNSSGNYFTVLSNLNSSLGGFYRYLDGTSMAAASISGMLALMQEYFATTLGLTNSPALSKALLINGARSLNVLYNMEANAVVNHQGWGLANITNSIPLTMTAGGGPVRFFEQSPTNALATGQSQTRFVTVASSGQAAPLRVTLVWTDPPGNPVTGVKLVNDLDLIVTNLTTGDVYVGNNMQGNFTQTSATNGLDLALVGDRVNNVENIYIPGPLGANYSVTVYARRVNVNAVNNHPDGVVQDYALVIASGDVTAANPNPFIITTPAVVNHPGAIVLSFPTNASPLLNLRVGANAPLLVSTNGATNQWNFFVFTNTTAFTNVAFVTFLPPNLSRARYREADLDLYVTVGDVGLLTLNPASLAAADKSLGRLGTEFITYSNSAAGTIYYVGVKSEDQQAANYGIFGTASELPFNGRDENGNQVLRGFAVPQDIPDGTPEQPMGVTIIAIGQPDTIQRVIVTNILTHEEAGDLFGNLSHNERFAVLNNHRTFFGTQLFVYDDSQQADTNNTTRTDGPGSLNDFIGEQAAGVWVLTVSDNALFHTGRVDLLTILIEPSTTNNNNGDINLTRTIQPKTFLYAAINVPPDATNLQVCVSGLTDPVQLLIRKGDLPNLATFDYSITVNPPGLCVDISPGDAPPLSPGRWYIGIYNPSPIAVTATLTATVTRNLGRGRAFTYASTGTPFPFLDDAVTNSLINVTNAGIIADLQVGVHIAHERASDLVLHLISARGTRLLLAENRGSTNALGYGAAITDTISIPRNSTGGPAEDRQDYSSGANSGTIQVAYDFFGLPDTLHIYYDGFLIYDSGLVGGASTVAVSYGPGLSTNVTVVINEGGAAALLTQWNYTATLVVQKQIYTTFIESTNAAVPPLKFAPAPFTNNYVAGGTNSSGTNYYSYYRPEEPLTPLIGEEALGQWYLEIWDNRAGGSLTNGQLLGWELQITYPNTNPPTLLLTNGIVSTNTFVGPGTVYFLVTLPCSNTTVTNTLTGLLGGPFDLIFNQSMLPAGTGTGPGDVILLANSTGGTSVLTGGTPPLLLPGFYYLGVSSTNAGTNSFTLRIDFDSTNCTAFRALAACDSFSTNIAAGAVMHFYQFPVSSNAVQANFELLGLDGNVDLFVTRGASPSVLTYDYASTNLGITDELVVVWTNSAPVPLTSGFWYLGVRNLDLTNVNYTVRATEILESSIRPLTNALPFANTVSAPCSTDYYRFTVSSNSDEAWFDIFSLTGDVNLYLTRGLPLPVGTNYHYAGLNPGAFDESISVNSGSPVALTTGDWYLAVVNVANVPVTYTVQASEFSVPVSALVANAGVTKNLAAGTSLQYFTYPVSSNAIQVNFELIALGGNVDLLVQPGSFPTPGTFTYASLQSGTGAELVSVATNSPVPLAAGLWYLGVVNRSAANVTYTVRVTEILASSLVTLTNGLYYGSTGREDHYLYTVSAAGGQAWFEIASPSGNVDLYLRRGLPLPSGTNFHYASVNPGAAAEQIIVLTSSPPVALTPGDWYLTVVSQTAGPVSYSVRASENAPPVLILPPNTNILDQVPFTATATATDLDLPANTLTFALVSGPAGLTVSPAGVIDWTPSEVQGPGTVVIRVFDDGTPSLSATNSFVVIVNSILPPTDFMITLVTNGLKLTWTAPSHEPFKVEWTADITPPRIWTTFTNLVTSTNRSFSFTDDGSQTSGLGGLRFYRLFYLP